MVFCTGSVVGFAHHPHLATRAGALAHQCLYQLTLPIAGDTSHPQYFTATHLQAHPVQCQRATVAQGT